MLAAAITQRINMRQNIFTRPNIRSLNHLSRGKDGNGVMSMNYLLNEGEEEGKSGRVENWKIGRLQD